MKMFRLLLTLGGLGLLAGGLSSCLHEPDYSPIPEIGVDPGNNIQLIRIKPAIAGGQPLDSVRITVRFQDGDGDLGLTSDERQVAPFTYLNADKTHNKFNNNFFVEPLVKNPVTGKFESLTVAGVPYPGVYVPGQYDGAFPHPTSLTDNKSAPLKGTITYAPIAFGLGDVFVPGQVVRFEVSIADRALHVSNVVRTDSIVIAPR